MNTFKLSIGDEAFGGIVFELDETGQHGKVCSIKDLGRLNWGDAMKACEAYRGGGYTDWYLPSKDELNLMYTNLYKKGLGGFDDFMYWSSTQDGPYSAYVQFLDNCSARYNNKVSHIVYFRSVRNF